MHKKLISAALAILPLVVSSAFAMAPFTDDMQKAYAPYRIVLFTTNTKSISESKRTIKKAQEAWNNITKQYTLRPPASYDHDTSFSTTLTEVGKVWLPTR